MTKAAAETVAAGPVAVVTAVGVKVGAATAAAAKAVAKEAAATVAVARGVEAVEEEVRAVAWAEEIEAVAGTEERVVAEATAMVTQVEGMVAVATAMAEEVAVATAMETRVAGSSEAVVVATAETKEAKRVEAEREERKEGKAHTVVVTEAVSMAAAPLAAVRSASEAAVVGQRVETARTGNRDGTVVSMAAGEVVAGEAAEAMVRVVEVRVTANCLCRPRAKSYGRDVANWKVAVLSTALELMAEQLAVVRKAALRAVALHRRLAKLRQVGSRAASLAWA